jgi:protein-S-isoprenylcysteine O-methyltransferase Ste14
MKAGNPVRLLLRVPVPWVFVLSYLVGVGLGHLFRPSVTSPEVMRVMDVGGVVLLVAGAALAGWSQVIFRRAGTTTVPGQSSTTLVTRGPYRFTRNPMYVGLIAAYVGEAGLLKQMAPLAVLLLTVAYLNWIVIPVEEARLHEEFGSAYDLYRSTVRRWL